MNKRRNRCVNDGGRIDKSLDGRLAREWISWIDEWLDASTTSECMDERLDGRITSELVNLAALADRNSLSRRHIERLLSDWSTGMARHRT